MKETFTNLQRKRIIYVILLSIIYFIFMDYVVYVITKNRILARNVSVVSLVCLIGFYIMKLGSYIKLLYKQEISREQLDYEFETAEQVAGNFYISNELTFIKTPFLVYEVFKNNDISCICKEDYYVGGKYKQRRFRLVFRMTDHSSHYTSGKDSLNSLGEIIFYYNENYPDIEMISKF